jgi:predicted glycoside hydrolase/deacetylase ChbG (UPF0249 family)
LNRFGLEFPSEGNSGPGILIINADDWGLDKFTTDRMLECAQRGRISTVSAMVFMADSERAAELSRSEGVCAGLHLNLTAPFSAANCPSALAERQRRLVKWTRGSRLSRVFFHPGLHGDFEYVVKAQFEEFERLYGAPPVRIDGHHHMHLCPNVLWTGLLPSGTVVRRNFSFRPREKGALNRLYRSISDAILARRHVVTDYFFSIAPLEPRQRITDILALAKTSAVELETHPAVPAEFAFLHSDEMQRLTKDIPLAAPII